MPQSPLQKTFLEWHQNLPNRLMRACELNENGSTKIEDPPKISAITNVASTVGLSTLVWCEKNGANVDDLIIKLHLIPRFLSDLFDALTYTAPWFAAKTTTQSADYKNSQLRRWLWAHIGPSILSKDIEYRENFIRTDELQACVYQYIKAPWWRNDYLDWVFLDALVGVSLFASVYVLNRRRFGIAYDLSKGTIWKTRLISLSLTPLTIAFGWVAPAIVFYKLSEYYYGAALSLAAVYYLWSLYLLLQWAKAHITHIIRFKKTSFGALRDMLVLSYPLIFSRAKMQLEVGASLRQRSYDES